MISTQETDCGSSNEKTSKFSNKKKFLPKGRVFREKPPQKQHEGAKLRQSYGRKKKKTKKNQKKTLKQDFLFSFVSLLDVRREVIIKGKVVSGGVWVCFLGELGGMLEVVVFCELQQKLNKTTQNFLFP